MADMKMRKSPIVYACAGEREELNIEIDLPGVKSKEDIVFKINENSFTIKATAQDAEYVGLYSTGGLVEPDRVVARFANERLIATVPYRKLPEEVEVEIE